MSVAVRFREEGNEAFMMGEKATSFKSKEEHYFKACRAYITSAEYATDNDERASAKKNLMIASLKHSELYDLPQSFKPLSVAISAMVDALSAGMMTKSEEWKRSTVEKMNDAISNFIVACQGLSMQERANHFKKLSLLFGNHNLFPFAVEGAAKLNMSVAELLFKLCVAEGEKKNSDFSAALNNLTAVENYLRLVEDFSRGSLLFNEKVEQLQADFLAQKSFFRAKQALLSGIALLSQATEETEDLDIDLIWRAFDLLTLACSIEAAVEVAAEAHGYLAQIYDSFLHDKTKAQDHGYLALSLALSLGKNLETHSLFLKVKKLVDELRRGSQQEPAETTILRSQIQDQLEQIDQARAKTSPIEFVTYLYANFSPGKIYPPKTGKERDKKCVLMAASITYARSETADPMKKQLFDEIVLKLNSILGEIKDQEDKQRK